LKKLEPQGSEVHASATFGNRAGIFFSMRANLRMRAQKSTEATLEVAFPGEREVIGMGGGKGMNVGMDKTYFIEGGVPRTTNVRT